MTESPSEALPEGRSAEAATLRRAAEAFEVGDFATVRKLCDQLSQSLDPDVVRVAGELRSRTEPDWAQRIVLVGCLIFFGWVVSRYLL